MERFVEKIQRVLIEAERQFRLLAGPDCEVQHSYLFRAGKFVGVRLACGNYQIEWQFETDQMSPVQEISVAAPLQADESDERQAA